MIESLVEHFTALDDPRCAQKVEHRLVDVLVIVVWGHAEGRLLASR